jgi:2-polyprenyl-6-methoxyphenol hydroxylase-like FAD-dependent oxidoreductase
MDIVIAGGGIGGLSTALFLHRVGLRARVYEQVPELKELGVGVNLHPQAVGEMARIGLDEALATAGNNCLEWGLFNRFGQEIWREPRGRLAGHDWPQISIHRGRLQGLLLTAVRQRLGPDAIVTGHRFTGCQQRGGKVTSRFATAGGEQIVESDILIGADGIHSTLRHILFPDEGPPSYGGSVLWRGTIMMEPFFEGRAMILAGYSGCKIIAYPMTAPNAEGMAEVNWLADLASDTMLNREDWNRKGRFQDFAPIFADWRFDWLDVPRMIGETTEVYEYPMVDRDPLPRWSFGRVTLLGDAAHPMYPVGSNGASQAIRDGAALAEALSEEADLDRALARYEHHRREPTAQIVMSNRGSGPETVMNIAHERAPNGFRHIHDVIPRAELEAVSQRYRTLTAAPKPVPAA